MYGQTMDMDLAAMYGTPGGPSQEDLEKNAQAELFAKLAADNGINLNELDDAQIASLWNQTFEKSAQEEEEEEGEEGKKKKKDEEEEKASAAAAEWMSQREYQEKIAEADKLGRVMAHSYVQELGYIGDAMEKDAKSKFVSMGRSGAQMAEEIAPTVAERLKGLGSRAAEPFKRVMRSRESAMGTGRAAETALKAGKGLKGVSTGTRARQVAIAAKGRAAQASPYAAGAGAAGGAGYAGYKKGKEKKSSAIDEYAYEIAFIKAAEAGFDQDEAIDRLNAIYTLDLEPEETKIASADSPEEAVEIRSLELLEAAGYPVEWE